MVKKWIMTKKCTLFKGQIWWLLKEFLTSENEKKENKSIMNGKTANMNFHWFVKNDFDNFASREWHNQYCMLEILILPNVLEQKSNQTS